METNIMPTQNMQKKIPYIFKDTHRKKTVLPNSVQEWLLGCL